MPPQKRAPGKARDTVQVDPPQAAQPRKSTTTKAEVQAAVERSAEHIAQQNEPPADVHPKPTTPTQAEVEAAVEQSAKTLEQAGQQVATPAESAPMAASPVSAGGTNAGGDSLPVSGSRDLSMDAAPVFSAASSNMPARDVGSDDGTE